MSGQDEKDTMNAAGQDALVQRYHEASALDPLAKPPERLRAAVLDKARNAAAERHHRKERHAANQPRWTWTAAASVMMLVAAGWIGMRMSDTTDPDDKTVVASADLARAEIKEEIAQSAGSGQTASAPAVAPSKRVEALTEEQRSPVLAQSEPAPLPETVRIQPEDAESRATAIAKAEANTEAEMETEIQTEAVASVDRSEKAKQPARPAPTIVASAPAARPADASSLADADEKPEGDAALPAAKPQAPAARARQSMAKERPQALEGWEEHLAMGRSPDERDAQGLTWLMRAASLGDSEAAQALLDAGAKRDLISPQGKTAADLARLAGHEALAARLLP
ncbi:hypothetical protein [Hydrogenophaga sp. 5NK40-0174]|uniref:hypothetical protein n=1 Tax=Hydrogenophaga sp. 5NK40-0174 TaxID=3127649 RepID=UPI00310AD931